MKAIVFILALALSPVLQCGLTPLKPLKPIGCKDLVASCVCDEDGKNCRYIWVCVK